jgi:hypothetical protein
MVAQIKSSEIFETFKLDEGAWLINQITAKLWGTELTFHALYDPDNPHTTLRLIFKDCTRITWDTYGSEIDERDVQTDVIGMDIGEDQHGKPAIVHTDLFEMFIAYGELVLEKDW